MNSQKSKDKPTVNSRFTPSEFEAKWQSRWESDKVYSPDIDQAKNPYYTLMMFPYPSAEGMHVGNMYAHTGADIHGRFRRMQGYDVFEPIGLDGFGIHSENYAMKVGRHPKEQAAVSEKNFYRQMHETGSGFDWQRTVETYDPDYYMWTQWLFTQMFKAGLAYKEKAVVNYCPSCKTVLSDEQVIAGECERCGSIVEKKALEQWFFRITQYAGRLLDNIPGLDWSEKVKVAQTNWIGRSKGALITFPIADFRLPNGEKPNFVFIHGFRGKPENDFWPWLGTQLEKKGFGVYAPQLPNTDHPTIDEQVSYLLENYTFNENTIIVTHSLGGVVALKLIPKLTESIAKVVLVAPPIRNEFKDGKKRPELDTATDWVFDYQLVKEKSNQITIISDITDPKLSQSHGRELAQNLNANLVETNAQFPHFNGKTATIVLKELLPCIDVFTTRPDTIFGATFVVIAPEHHIVNGIKSLEYNIEPGQVGAVKTYVENALKKSENERIADGNDKTGVFTGLYALNPATEERVPIWVADYVLGGYGTGAIMAVPAHDRRDYDFAKKYNLPVKHVIMPSVIDTENPPQEGKENTRRTVIIGIVRDPKQNKYLILKWKHQDWKTFITGGVEEGEDLAEAAKREITEETGYTDLKLVRELGGPTEAFFYAAHKGVNRQTKAHIFLFELSSNSRQEIASDEQDQHEAVWMTEEEVVKSNLRHGEFELIWGRIKTGNDAYVGDGLLQNSGDLTGYHSKEDADKILDFISDTGIGYMQEQYHLRDWLISRQRYWGPPIPMIYCESCAKQGKSWFDTEEAQTFANTKSQASNPKQSENSNNQNIGNWKLEIGKSQAMPGWYPVSDENLPIELPDIEDFKPMGKGTSPLANHPEFYEVSCPHCGGKAMRETDVSDTFLDSAWYFFRYISTEQKDRAFSVERAKRWLPVDIYIGGAEHSVLHLLYARFTTMVLHDLGYIDHEEPFAKFYAHGLLIKEGAKMSKSKGNVIIPDEYIAKYGADTLRSYLMFLGPFSQGGDFYDTGIEGMYRFLRRVWVLLTQRVTVGEENEEITRACHKTIAGVTKDMEEFGFNTALAKLMEFYNRITQGRSEFEEIVLSEQTTDAFVKMLAPFAPHMTEEIWQSKKSAEGVFKSIHHSVWPTYEEKYLVDSEMPIVVQVNGKRRGEITVSADQLDDQNTIESLARKSIEKYLTGTVKKVIYVPGKIINFVIPG